MTLYCTSEITVKPGEFEAVAHPVRCKRWSCPYCAELNRQRVIGIARRAKPKAMLTLTISSTAYPDPADAALRLKEGLRLLRLRLKRHPRLQNFEFMAVFEKHKSGHPHLHLLIRGSFIPWQWLKRVWREITGSTRIDIRQTDRGRNAALYIAKYIGKDLSAFPGCKRWWRSHGFSAEDEPTEREGDFHGQWGRYHATIDQFESALRILGFDPQPEGREGVRWKRRGSDPFAIQHVARYSGQLYRSFRPSDEGRGQ